MKLKFLIYILIGLILFYFLQPIPYCKLQNKPSFDTNAIYTTEEKQELREVEILALNVQGNSMYPTILNNSRCLCVRQDEYSVGDIIFYFANINGQLNGVLHRIIKIENDSYYPRGDNNNFVDPPMAKESIVCAIPNVPRIFTFF